MEFLKAMGIDVLLCDSTSFMDDILLQMNSSTDPEAIIPSREIPAGMLDSADANRELFKILESQTGLCIFNFYLQMMRRRDLSVG